MSKFTCSRCTGTGCIYRESEFETFKQGELHKEQLKLTIQCPDCDGVGNFDNRALVDAEKGTMNGLKFIDVHSGEISVDNQHTVRFKLTDGKYVNVIGGQIALIDGR